MSGMPAYDTALRPRR